jgi:hypothetical protein
VNVRSTADAALSAVGVKLFRMRFPFILKDSSELLVRHDVRRLWREVMKLMVGEVEAQPCVLVKGPAGVGKSVSALYGLRLLLKANLTVVLEVQGKDEGYLFTPSEEGYRVVLAKRFRTSVPPQAFDDALLNGDVVYLVDPGQADKCPEPLYNGVKARTVLVSSPDVRHFKQWHSGRGAVTFYMSTWTDEEMRAARPFVCPNLVSEDFDARLHDFGGVLRPFVANAEELQSRWGAQQQAALKGQVINQVAAFGLLDTDSDKKPPPTSLFMFIPTANFRECSIGPISAYAAAALAYDQWSKIEEMAAARHRLESGIWGGIWEGAIKVALASGGTFLVRRAGDRRTPASKLILERRPLVAIPGGWVPFEAAVAAADGKTMMAPANANQPAVDLADGRLRGFQATLAERHPVSNRIVALLDTCKVSEDEKFQIYFAVPKCHFDKFPWQKCRDKRVEQWVLRLSKSDFRCEPKSYRPGRERAPTEAVAPPKKKAKK